ncbi:MAG: SET domain-containing protein-lysine N-methyltransferase [Candidatus Aenigmatarchaeota archaeon]
MSRIFVVKKCRLGRGLFAARDIKKGEVIFYFNGKIMSGNEVVKSGREPYPIQIGDDKYMDWGEPGELINHSCNPNAGVKNDNHVIAIKNIKKGEEITWDYSTSMDEDCWTMKCYCGSKNCRKRIRDFKYLPKNLQKRYLKLGIVQSFIAKKFAKMV